MSMTYHSPSIAVIGCGDWGQNIIRTLSHMGALAAIIDIYHGDKAQALSLSYQVPLLYPEDLLNHPHIQGVIIATPTPTHFELASSMLKAGRHVLVEKPMVTNLEQNRSLEKLAHDQKRVLMVGHLLQYHPAFRAILELVHQEALGDIQYVQSNRMNLGKLHNHDDVLWDFVPHDLSMILKVMERLPQAVRATSNAYVLKGIGDICLVELQFDKEKFGRVFLSRLNPFKEHKLTVIGKKAMAVFDDTQPWSHKLTLTHYHMDLKEPPKIMKGEVECITLPASEPLRLECQHFIDAIKEETSVRTPAKDAEDVLTIILQAQKSLQTGDWVKIID